MYLSLDLCFEIQIPQMHKRVVNQRLCLTCPICNGASNLGTSPDLLIQDYDKHTTKLFLKYLPSSSGNAEMRRYKSNFGNFAFISKCVASTSILPKALGHILRSFVAPTDIISDTLAMRQLTSM